MAWLTERDEFPLLLFQQYLFWGQLGPFVLERSVLLWRSSLFSMRQDTNANNASVVRSTVRRITAMDYGTTIRRAIYLYQS